MDGIYRNEVLKMFNNIIANVRNTVPLVHNITNYVTVNDCANILLACGGSPIMADDAGEVEEITSICGALNINIGTLNKNTIESMFIAARRSNELGHITVLDPVGAGASTLRTETANNLVNEIKFDLIKGNVSEIKTIYDNGGHTKGVDADESDAISADNIEGSAEMAKNLSKRTGAIIVITGAIDIVADKDKAYAIYNGHRLMSKITGTGCMLSAMLGAYLTANKDNKLCAAAAAVCAMGIAGERAVERAIECDAGSGSLRTFIIDEIYKMTDEILNENAKCELIGEKEKSNVVRDKFLANSMKLYAVTDRGYLKGRTLFSQVEAAIKGGATFIQLREKEASEDEFVSIAKEIKGLTDKYKVPFVINDNVNVAMLVDADGVHVGQSDLEAKEARKLIGANKILGVSVHSVSQALEAEANGADYLGVGSVFNTMSKDDADSVSYDTLKAICEAVSIPVVAIGGISIDNVSELSGSGISGVAVISALFNKDDVEKAAKDLLEKVEEIIC